MGAEVQEILQRGWWLLAIGLLSGLAVSLGVGLALGSTAVAGLLAGNAGGVVAALVGMRGAPVRRSEVSTAA